MALFIFKTGKTILSQPVVKCNELLYKNIHTTSAVCKVQSGKYKVTTNRSRPLTYEMSLPPQEIAHKKSWNSWNTSNLFGETRRSETAIEDLFIRRFITGTWHGLVLSEIIIKRQFNHIRVAAILKRGLPPTKMYFLIGYSEELLSNWLQCPVTLELQTIENPKDIIFKYI